MASCTTIHPINSICRTDMIRDLVLGSFWRFVKPGTEQGLADFPTPVFRNNIIKPTTSSLSLCDKMCQVSEHWHVNVGGHTVLSYFQIPLNSALDWRGRFELQYGWKLNSSISALVISKGSNIRSALPFCVKETVCQKTKESLHDFTNVFTLNGQVEPPTLYLAFLSEFKSPLPTCIKVNWSNWSHCTEKLWNFNNLTLIWQCYIQCESFYIWLYDWVCVIYIWN